MRHLFRTAALAAASMLAAFSAAAQTWPTRPITLVVPFAAGSGSDTGARIVGEYLGAALGQRLVVENRVGAVGAIGAAAVARAQPDGYTLLVGTNSTHGSNPALLATMPYDPIKDFVPIVRVGIFTYFVVVNPGLPIRSMADLVAEAKAKPDQLSYGSGSSTSLVMAETFLRGVGIKALRVPYTSNPPALTDIIAGRVSFMFVDVSTSIAHVARGRSAGDRDHLADAQLRRPGRADNQGDRAAELRHGILDRILRAGRHAAADRRAPGRRDREGPRPAGGQGTARPARRRHPPARRRRLSAFYPVGG